MPIFFGKISRDTGVAWYVERDGSMKTLKKLQTSRVCLPQASRCSPLDAGKPANGSSWAILPSATSLHSLHISAHRLFHNARVPSHVPVFAHYVSTEGWKEQQDLREKDLSLEVSYKL